METTISYQAVNSSSQSKARKEACDLHIHKAAAAGAAAAGASAVTSLPLVPLVVIPTLMGLEVKLTISIAHEFGVDLSEAAARGVAGSLGCTVVGLAASLGLTSLLPIPVVGVGINAGVAAAVIEGFGHLVYNHYNTRA